MLNLNQRRLFSSNKFSELRSKLPAAEARIEGRACVYATGSYGRQEASAHSDLDLFIVGLRGTKSEKNGIKISALSNLDAICVKADLIEVTSQSGIKKFDGDGKYLSHFSVDKLAKTLGRPEDDVENTFTARVLLLLESRPLLGSKIYDDIISDIIASYWRDYEDHKGNFVPAFLTNDILRLWRTFCINYEAGTLREPDEEKAKGKIKNYKLKHGRILTCYSAILYLLGTFDLSKTVTPDNAINMVRLTPTERLEWLLAQEHLVKSHSLITNLLDHYEQFLINTNFDEQTMLKKFAHPNDRKTYTQASHGFGETMFDALNSIGNNSRLHKLIVV